MNIPQIVEETRESLKSNKDLSTETVVDNLLNKNYEDIERDLLGSSAIDCLPITPETQAAIPQGNPFLKYAEHIRRILKKYKGIYSLD